MNLGTKIRVARAHRGFTQRELARRAGLSPAFVSGIERVDELGNTSAKALSNLADALDVPLQFFLDPEAEEPDWDSDEGSPAA